MALDYKGSLNRYRKYLQTVRGQPLMQASFWLILSLVLLILLITLALRPTLVTVAGLVGQIKQQERIASQLDKKIVSVQAAGTELQKIKNRIRILDAALPNESKWEGFADTVKQVATDSGISLTEIVFKGAPVKGKLLAITSETKTKGTETKTTLPAGVTGISFSISGQGYYDSVRDFIARLEKIRRMILITSVQIAKQESGILIVTIEGVAAFTAPINLP